MRLPSPLDSTLCSCDAVVSLRYRALIISCACTFEEAPAPCSRGTCDYLTLNPNSRGGSGCPGVSRCCSCSSISTILSSFKHPPLRQLAWRFYCDLSYLLIIPHIHFVHSLMYPQQYFNHLAQSANDEDSFVFAADSVGEKSLFISFRTWQVSSNYQRGQIELKIRVLPCSFSNE